MSRLEALGWYLPCKRKTQQYSFTASQLADWRMCTINSQENNWKSAINREQKAGNLFPEYSMLEAYLLSNWGQWWDTEVQGEDFNAGVIINRSLDKWLFLI